MNKYKAYLSLLVFALAMGVRCFQPELTQRIRARVFEAVDREYRFVSVVETIGREYADGGLRGELVGALVIDRWLMGVQDADNAALNENVFASDDASVSPPVVSAAVENVT